VEEADAETAEVAHLIALAQQAGQRPIFQPVRQLDGFADGLPQLGDEPLPAGRPLLHDFDAAWHEACLPGLEIREVLSQADQAALEEEHTVRQVAAPKALFDLGDAHGLGGAAQKGEDLLRAVAIRPEHVVAVGGVKVELLFDLLGEELAHRAAKLLRGAADELVYRFETYGERELPDLRV